jgi:hypothetical protein
MTVLGNRRDYLMRTQTRRLLIVTVFASFAVPSAASAQIKRYALQSAEGLRLHNVTATSATLNGKKGVRIEVSQDAMQRLRQMTPDERNFAEELAVVDGVEFSSGVIEIELAGAPPPDAQDARGFVGIAFRLQNDMRTYDAFYLRPTNGRAEDQERRNRATQYMSHPDWPWFRLRRETPGRYESYVDLVPAVWTKIRIEVRGDKARLFVNDGAQPALIVNDVKSGSTAKGAVALWIEAGTVAHFRNLVISAGAEANYRQ